MDTLKQLIKKRDELLGRIRECRERLPAHSTKPSAMMELLDLEDAYDAILKKIEKKNQ